MKESKIIKVFLVAILLLAALLRLWGLADYPAGFNADEAAIGYNANSLLQTGRDEEGHAWPVNFQSFDDWKPGGYFYLVLPFVKLLGLSETAVRLPSALLGILAVWLIYLLAFELLKDKRAGLASALLLAISPWHLQFSRGGWESNAATTFLLLGTYLFLKSFSNPRLYFFSLLSYLASTYTYQSTRIIAPLLLLGLLFYYRKKILDSLKPFIVAASFIFLLSLPLIFSLFSSQATSRFSGVGLFADTGPVWRINELRSEHGGNTPLPRLVHNKIVGYTLKFSENYLSHFEGNFLFLSGDVIERSRVPETGQMNLIDSIFVLAGIYFLVKRKIGDKFVIFYWLAIAPLAAALTFQVPHALRSLNMVIPMILIASVGMVNIVKIIWSQRKFVKIPLLAVMPLLILWSFGRYLHEYYTHYPQTYPSSWEYGFRELTDFVKPRTTQYNKIYITNAYDQPYILFLFYLNYPPDRFQREVVLEPRDQFGFSTVSKFSNFYFEGIQWDNLGTERNILVCGTDKEIPQSVEIVKAVYFPDGKPAFLCAEHK